MPVFLIASFANAASTQVTRPIQKGVPAKQPQATLPRPLSDAELDQVEGKIAPVVLKAVGGAALGVLGNAASNAAQGKPWHEGAVGAGLIGALGGGPLISTGSKVVARATTNTFGKTFSTTRTVSVSGKEAAKSAAYGAVGGAAQKAADSYFGR